MAAQTQSNSSNNDLGHSTFLENDVPMQGDGYYNSHSALQAAAMHRALSLFDTISVNTTQKSDKFTVAEYGCAQGANSSVSLISLFLQTPSQLLNNRQAPTDRTHSQITPLWRRCGNGREPLDLLRSPRQ